MYFIVFLIAFFATFIIKEIDTNILYLSRFILIGCFMISCSIDECIEDFLKKQDKTEKNQNVSNITNLNNDNYESFDDDQFLDDDDY